MFERIFLMNTCHCYSSAYIQKHGIKISARIIWWILNGEINTSFSEIWCIKVTVPSNQPLGFLTNIFKETLSLQLKFKESITEIFLPKHKILFAGRYTEVGRCSKFNLCLLNKDLISYYQIFKCLELWI